MGTLDIQGTRAAYLKLSALRPDKALLRVSAALVTVTCLQLNLRLGPTAEKFMLLVRCQLERCNSLLFVLSLPYVVRLKRDSGLPLVGGG